MAKSYTKFKKIKNFYGIKELRNLDRISKDTIIYAPNGVMKTSFSDGLYNIANNIDIVDAFGQNKVEFEIEQNSKTYSENSNDGSLQCIVFSGKYLKTNLFSDPNMASLALSASLKEAFSKEKNELMDIKDELDRICSINIRNGKKKAANSWLSVRKIIGGNSVEEFIEKLLLVKNDLAENYKNLSFNAVCNDQVTNLFSNIDFINKLSIYRDVVENKMNEQIFNSGFNFSGLKKLRETINETHYFDAKHRIEIGENKIETLEELDSFILYQKEIIFSSDEVSTAYTSVDLMLNSNANTRAFSKLLLSNFDLLARDDDIVQKQKELVRSKITDIEDTLIDLRKRQVKATSNLSAILERAKSEQSTWKIVKDVFNFRFALNRTDLDIAYVDEDGFPVPRIIEIDRVTGQTLNDEMINRFSEGEKRALFILNLLFEIESKKLEWNDCTLIILDDIADSFDYQNKYAICKYIQELYSNPSFHVITLTHNFDFYRCFSYFLSKMHISGCFAQKNRNSIKLLSGIPKEYLSLEFSSSWKGRLGGGDNSNFENITTFFSMLPIIRNEYEIEESTKGENYKLMCELLHRVKDTHSNNLTKFKDIFDEKISSNLDPVYYSYSFNELMKKCYDKLLNSTIEETKISSKMACAVLLRIFFEEFIIMKSRIEKITFNEKTNEKITALYDDLVAKNKLAPDDKLHCEFASIICNPYVHVNSFMYEQLIDNSADKLVEYMKYFAEESNIFKVDLN